MKWPWVSRELYERASWDAAMHREGVTLAAGQYATLSTRYADLLEKYHALKLLGAEVPAPRLVPEKREPDPVVLAVNAAGRSPAVRSLMLQQAKRDRAAGMEDTEIVDRIERGTGVDGVPG